MGAVGGIGLAHLLRVSLLPSLPSSLPPFLPPFLSPVGCRANSITFPSFFLFLTSTLPPSLPPSLPP